MRFLPGLFFVLALFGASSGGALAQPESDASARAIQNVIREQLAAVNANDAQGAFRFASPKIRGIFDDPDRFMAMVENGYPQIYRSQGVEFGSLSEGDGYWVQQVTVTGRDGTLAVAKEDADAKVSVKAMADALHMVMDSDRTVYTRKIVNRLAAKEKVIKASEHFDDEKALVLPAQMFRFGSEMVAEKVEKDPEVDFSYSLQSLWPVNKQNAPKTDAEKAGLKFVAENKGKNYYTVEELGGTKYFTAVYADTAVAPVCVSCHNEHKDTPRTDFKIGDVMGGVVIRIPIES